jgi:two-component system, OmpR family, sensor histidine kinase CiaH
VAATDKTILTELLNILMDNAIKYCDPQGTIKATLVPEGKKGFSLSVSNHYARGEGEDYTHYFERFYRGDKSHDSTIPGYGIGLSIAREMADLLDGQITVSYKDKVICFSLHFN